MVIVIRKEGNEEITFGEVSQKSLKKTVLQENCIFEEVKVKDEILYRMVLPQRKIKEEEEIVRIKGNPKYEIEERKNKLFLKIYKNKKVKAIFLLDEKYPFYSEYDHLELVEEDDEICVNDLDKKGVVQFTHSTDNPGILYRVPL